MYSKAKNVKEYLDAVPEDRKKPSKSCIRFKKPEQIPFDLIGQLMQKISVKDWIDFFENSTKK